MEIIRLTLSQPEPIAKDSVETIAEDYRCTSRTIKNQQIRWINYTQIKISANQNNGFFSNKIEETGN